VTGTLTSTTEVEAMTNPPQLATSVIIPVYNGARYLPATLATVARQTVAPLEVLVVDDGSTDDSAEVVEAFRTAHPELPLRLIRQENAGQSATRNRAVELAAGDLIAFLDQDDRWAPRHIEVLSAPFARDEGVGLSYGDFDEIDGDGNIVVRGFLAVHNVLHPRSSIMEWLGTDTMVIPTASMVRREAFLEVGGFDPRLIGYEDDDLWVRMFRAGWRAHFTPESIAAFRVHPGSSSHRATFRESRVIFLEKYAALLPDAPELHRYYVSDMLFPRLVRAALGEYLGHLRAHRDDEARATARTVDAMFAIHKSRMLRKPERMVLRHPNLTRALLRARHLLLVSPRRRLNPQRMRDAYYGWSG